MKLSDLTQVALLGTGSHPLPAVTGDDALAQLLKQLDASRKERSLLAAATLLSLHERAAALPAQDAVRVPPPCAAETRAALGGAAATLLRRMLLGEHRVLLPECLELMRGAERVAPPEVVPALLDVGSQSQDLREAILEVAGARGPWLAALNDAWAWASGGSDDDSAWQEGKTAARALFLRRLRATDPVGALQLLASSWPTEAPDDRATLLAELETGLGAADEAFLESALDDKRKEVRRVAASLLARLPGSALAARMTARVLAHLAFTPGEGGALLKLRRAKKPHLEVTLPAECDKAMQRDGIEPKPPQGTGEKAWWLAQMIAAAPLASLTAAWKATPDEILVAASDGDFDALLTSAFTRAACAQRDAAWADALAERNIEAVRLQDMPVLVTVLTPQAREARTTALLQNTATRGAGAACVDACSHAWSQAFSRVVLGWLRGEAAAPFSYFWTRASFENVALRLAPAALAEAASGWPEDSPHWTTWSKNIDALLATAQARAALHSGIHRSHDEPSRDGSP